MIRRYAALRPAFALICARLIYAKMRRLAVIIPAAAIPAAVHSDAAMAQMPSQFTIIRDGGSPIGHHSVAFSRDGDGNLVVQIEIDIAVRMAFVTVFRYRHSGREVWRGDRLIALQTETNDDGQRMSVSARATPEGVEVIGPHGRLVLPPDIRTTSWWRADTMQQRQLLDNQDGRVVNIVATPAGTVMRRRGEQDVPITMWRLSPVGGYSDIALGYTARGQWAAMHFRSRGSRIDYAEPGETSTATFAR